MPLSEDISRIVVVFQRIGGWEKEGEGQLPRAPTWGVAKFVEGEGTRPAIKDHKCSVASLGANDAQNSSAYFKQFYHMGSEILMIIYIFFIEVKFKKLDMQFCSILCNYFRIEVIKTAKCFELKPGNHHQPFSPPPLKPSKVFKKILFP